MRIFVLKGIPYIPHYEQKDVWVTFENGTLTTATLKRRKAVERTDRLWARTWVTELGAKVKKEKAQ
jgi:hypothetical protein